MDNDLDDSGEGYRGPPSLGDLGRIAARKIGETIESFEAAEPDENHRGPASLGDMAAIAIKVMFGVFLLLAGVLSMAMICGGGTCNI